MAFALAASLATASLTPQCVEPLSTVNAASKMKLNKKSATIKVGKSIQLKVQGTKKKVKYMIKRKRSQKDFRFYNIQIYLSGV